MASSPLRRRRRVRSAWFAAASIMALASTSRRPNYSVQSLLMPPSPRKMIHASFNSRGCPSLRNTASSIHRRFEDADPTSPTALHLFFGFDTFLHPYGVSPSNVTNDHDDEQLELLEALLPRPLTKEEKARILEGFQRARLDEQLRLSKRSKGGGCDEKDSHFLADDEDEVARMTDLFQQARLAEQLRLSKNKGLVGSSHDDLGHFTDNIDKDEAFQRALLEERLKIRQLQQQRQRFVSRPEPIEQAMMEFETESSREKQKAVQMTMVQDQEYEAEEATEEVSDVNDFEEGNEDSSDAFIIGSVNAYNNDGIPGGSVRRDKLPVNQTGDASKQQLSDKLEKLHRMVAIATTSSSSSSVALSTCNATTSLQRFLSTTHLPLPPSEDASMVSLALAPVAHLLTSMFLLGAAGFYAAMAILDVIWNDNKGEHSTRACLRETASVCKNCWEYVFPAAGKGVDCGVAQRTVNALQTFVVASFYATRCVCVRAAKHSKHASECMDAGTGCLRYLVYALRSANVIWTRMVGAIKQRTNRTTKEDLSMMERRNNQTWNRRLSPLRTISGIKNTVAGRLSNRRSARAEQKRLGSEDLYNKKLRLLNLDRVALERDRQQLQEERRELEVERRKLMSEGLNVLAWYSAAREAAAAAEELNRQEGQKQHKKRHWSLWAGKGDDK